MTLFMNIHYPYLYIRLMKLKSIISYKYHINASKKYYSQKMFDHWYALWILSEEAESTLPCTTKGYQLADTDRSFCWNLDLLYQVAQGILLCESLPKLREDYSTDVAVPYESFFEIRPGPECSHDDRWIREARQETNKSLGAAKV